jgi:hypothetical protein
VTSSAGNWLEVALKPESIGATVEVTANGQKQKSQRIAGSGYLSQDDWRLHFGLGTATKADRVVVTWPSGKRQVLENVAAGQVVTVREE